MPYLGPKRVCTPAQMAANKRNAQHAGRPKGRKNTKTIILEKAKQQIDQAIAAKALELIGLQLTIARQAIDNPSPANQAIDSLLDRAFGRPAQRIETTGDALQQRIQIVHHYADDSDPPLPVISVQHPSTYGTTAGLIRSDLIRSDPPDVSSPGRGEDPFSLGSPKNP